MIQEYITVENCSIRYNIELSFINSLEESGLIEVMLVEEIRCLPYNQLQPLEKFVQWHYDLDINMEGIEALQHLLEKINKLQQENKDLKEQLKLYLSNRDLIKPA